MKALTLAAAAIATALAAAPAHAAPSCRGTAKHLVSGVMIAQQFEFNSNAAIELRADLDACPVPITTAYASGPGTLIE
jgi:hypothetical protein